MNYEKLKKVTFFCVAAVASAVIVAFVFGYCLPVLLPFLLSLIMSYPVRVFAGRISGRSRIPYKLVSILSVTVLLAFLICLTVFVGNMLLSEITDFAESLAAELGKDDNFISRISEYLLSLKERFPKAFAGELLSEDLYSALMEALLSKALELSGFLTDAVGDIVSGAPSFIFSLAVFVISMFYFSADKGELQKIAATVLPPNKRKKAKVIKAGLIDAFSGYLRAEAVLLILTFCELLLGFSLIGVDYALLYAVIVAFIDLLPVFGVGTVLVPWSVYSVVIGNYSRGIGLLVLFGIMYAVRQFAEPKLLGKYMNIHPLVALFATFAGFEFFGVTGMIFFPLCLYGVKSAMGDGED